MSSPTEPTMRPSDLPLGYRLTRLGRLIRKELSEILRDRRTILTLVLMPLMLYPLISIALQQFFVASGMDLSGQKAFRVGFVDDHEKDVFFALMDRGEKLSERRKPDKSADQPAPSPFSPENCFRVKDAEMLDKLVLGGAVDLGIHIANAERLALAGEEGGITPLLPEDESLKCELIYKADSLRGISALTLAERRLAAVNNATLARRLGLNVTPKVVLMRPQITALRAASEGFLSLSALVPLVLILMTMTGAVYPAIDLTAGERERGTLEMLIAAPVPRLSLLFAKYVSVVSVATLTALVNLTAMITTLFISGLSALVFADRAITFVLVMQLLGLLLLFAAFFSAVLLSLTSFARSFKEAQAYLIPLMLVSFAPGMMGMMPGLKLEGGLTIVPLLNIVLLSRDLLEGQADPLSAVVIIASTILYAMAAISVAAKFFGSEAVLYGTENNWSDLWRRPRHSEPHPSVATAFMCLALMLPTWFVLRGVTAQLGFPPVTMLLLMAVLSVVLFAGFPTVAALHRRIQWRSGFQLYTPRWLAVVAAVLLGISAWPLVFQVLAVLNLYFKLNLLEYERLLRSARNAGNDYPLLMAACVMLPAIVEEFFFRGFLFSAIRAKLSGFTTVIITALLFAFFHIITGLFIQLVPSLLLGLLLGWICLKSGSVLPGMLMHAIHNGMMVMVGATDISASKDLPLHWLILGGVGTVAGLALLGISSPPKRQPSARNLEMR